MQLDRKELSNYIYEIKKGFDDYENKIYNILSIIKNTEFYWNDGYTKSFFNKIRGISEDIMELDKSLDKVYYDYNDLLDSYNNLASIYGMPNIINSANYLSNSTVENEQINKTIYLKICEIEDNMMNELSHTKIYDCSKKSFDNLDIEVDSMDFLGMKDEMPNFIKKLSIELTDLNSLKISILNSLSNISGIYKSKNIKKINEINDNIEKSIYNINESLYNAYNYMLERKSNYKNFADNLVDGLSQIRYEG